MAFNISDDRGNLLNLPLNTLPPRGTYRTMQPSNTPSSVMVPVKTNQGNAIPGFTPQEAFYVKGTQSVNSITGLPVEAGDYPDNITPNYAAYHTSRSNQIGQDIIFDREVGYSVIDDDYYIINGVINPDTGQNAEYGTMPKNKDPYFNIVDKSKIQPTTPVFKLDIGRKSHESFDNNTTSVGQYDFIHALDGINPLPDITSTGYIPDDIHLGSFVQTFGDNEDPVAFGYDIIINQVTSPLFNGAIIDFISTKSDLEIVSRASAWENFVGEFFRFFNSNGNVSNAGLSSSRFNASSPGAYINPDTKIYYLKKLSGLDNLVEKGVSVNSDTVKSMVDYGKDVIKLSLYEDVKISTGTLAMLYKTMSWSRRNGKQLIPENLLRFDVDIEITEIRNFNRVIKAVNDPNNTLNVYSDIPPKYIYTLYDCQFEFPNMSHPGEIDMTEKKFTDDFDIQFNYKYSTLRMERFKYSGDGYTTYTIDNNNTDINSPLAPYSTTNAASYSNYKKDYPIISASQSYIETLRRNAQLSQMTPGAKAVGLTGPLQQAKKNDTFGKLLAGLGEKITKAVNNQINSQTTNQARLLNNTLDNIRNSLGVGRMSSPTNVYETNPLSDDIKNAFRDFVGKSIKGFFSGDL